MTSFLHRDELRGVAVESQSEYSDLNALLDRLFLDKDGNEADDGGEIIMVNFVRLREKPHYPRMPELKPEWVKTGADADMHYGKTFISHAVK